jgi:hypothetical protein
VGFGDSLGEAINTTLQQAGVDPPKLLPRDIAAAAKRAGVPDSALAAATAIALAESGGNVRAMHKNSDKHRTTDYGLWQINGYWHPEFTPAELLTVSGNARAMAKISRNGADWSAWTTYGTQRYKDKLPEAEAAALDAKSVPQGVGEILDVTSGVVAAADPLGALSDAFGSFVSAILDVGFWKRVGIGLAGVALLAGGAVLVAKDSLLSLAIESATGGLVTPEQIGGALNGVS